MQESTKIFPNSPDIMGLVSKIAAKSGWSMPHLSFGTQRTSQSKIGSLFLGLMACWALTTPAQANRSVVTWGQYLDASLAEGFSRPSLRPNAVVNGTSSSTNGLLQGVTALAAGDGYTLALKDTGTVWGWGVEFKTNRGATYTQPAEVTGLSGITTIAAGRSHSLALKSDGTVWSWGAGYAGQLGNGGTANSSMPVQVNGLSGVTAIAGGEDHSLALKSDGTVWSWGSNNRGQLGNNTISQSLIPIPVNGLSNVVAISAGVWHSVALKRDGTVWVWGDNYYFQLGRINMPLSNVPLEVEGLNGIISIDGGGAHSLALKSDGTVWSWGSNSSGQVGNGSTANGSPVVQVSDLGGIIAVSGGGTHSVALKSDGTVWCWGAGYSGQIGNGTLASSPISVEVSGLSGIAAIAAGTYHTAAVAGLFNSPPFATDDVVSVYNPGSPTVRVLANDFDLNGDSMTIVSAMQGEHGSVSVLDNNLVYTPDLGFAGVDSFTYTLSDGQNTSIPATVRLVVISDGNMRTWGSNEYGALGNASIDNSATPAFGGISSPAAIAGGDGHSVALKNGTVWSWGHGGVLGNGENLSSLIPVQASNITGVSAISANGFQTLALKGDGTVWGWGYTYFGEPGEYNMTTHLVPFQLSGLSDITAVAAGQYHGLALKSDGTVWSWGKNTAGQLGIGTSSISNPPTQVGGLSDVTAIAAGTAHSLALKRDGTVWAWGDNYAGQLGNNSTTASFVPVLVKGLSGTTAIAAGDGRSLAIKSDGTLWSWGDNYHGTLGDGTRKNSSTPVKVSGLGDVTAVAAGSHHCLALTNDGSVWSWGSNYYYQLGNSSGGDSLLPIPIKLSQGDLFKASKIAAGYFHSLSVPISGENDTIAPSLSLLVPVHNSVLKRLEGISGKAFDNEGGSGIARVIAFLRRVKAGTTAYEYWAKRNGIWSWGDSNSGIETTLSGNNSWGVSPTFPAGTTLPSGANFRGGSYHVYARAYDRAGNVTMSAINKVTVDTSAPTSVEVTTPAHNSTIKGLTSIKGTAADGTGGSGIAKVVAYLRRFKSGSTTTYEYWAKHNGTWSWGDSNNGFDTVFSAGSWSVFANTPTGTQLPSGEQLPTGSYQFYAYAYDKAATFKISNINKVTVDNVVPSSCIVTSPGKNATISTLTVIKGTATDASGGSGIARVDVFLRRGPSGSYQYWARRNGVWGWGTSATPIPTILSGRDWRVDNTAPAGTQLPTGNSNFPAGTYQVFAKAYDKAENALLSAINSISVVSGGSEATNAENPSSVVLSSASVQVSSGTVRLVFSSALDAGTSSDSARYSVSIDGAAVAVESVQVVSSTTVVLGLEKGRIQAGDRATVSYRLTDSKGSVLDGTVKVTAK